VVVVVQGYLGQGVEVVVEGHQLILEVGNQGVVGVMGDLPLDLELEGVVVVLLQDVAFLMQFHVASLMLLVFHHR
jgi:hypothetical protein